MKKWFLFALSIVLAEILIATMLIVFFLWVERDYCAPYFRASGHCYANWFSSFELVFYGVSAALMSSAVVLIWRYFFHR